MQLVSMCTAVAHFDLTEGAQVSSSAHTREGSEELVCIFADQERRAPPKPHLQLCLVDHDIGALHIHVHDVLLPALALLQVSHGLQAQSHMHWSGSLSSWAACTPGAGCSVQEKLRSSEFAQ